MKKTSGFTVIASIVLLLLAFSPACLNQTLGKEMDRKGGNGPGPRMEWKLDLTNEQKEKITAKEKAMESETSLLRKTIHDLTDQLNAQLSADNPDNAKINTLIEDISKNMTDIQKKRISFMLWMRDQLTPEQKQKLLTLLKNRQGSGAGSEEPGGFPRK